MIVAAAGWKMGVPLVSSARTDLAVHRAGRQVSKLGMPAHLSQCDGSIISEQPSVETKREESHGLICWQGAISPIQATVEVRSILLRLNAQQVTASCASHVKLGSICDLAANLSGTRIVMSLTPVTSGGHLTADSVFVSGGSGPLVLPPLGVPASWTTVPLPAT